MQICKGWQYHSDLVLEVQVTRLSRSTAVPLLASGKQPSSTHCLWMSWAHHLCLQPFSGQDSWTHRFLVGVPRLKPALVRFLGRTETLYMFCSCRPYAHWWVLGVLYGRSYAFCCSVNTLCICGEPPVYISTRTCKCWHRCAVPAEGIHAKSSFEVVFHHETSADAACHLSL